MRQAQSKDVIDKLKKRLDKSQASTPPKCNLVKAIDYLSNQWLRLIDYLEGGAYPIDNNLAENSIRPFVIGRKNWFCSQSQEGAASSAYLYSLIITTS